MSRIEQEICRYYYPDHDEYFSVVAVYVNTKDLWMDVPGHYYVKNTETETRMDEAIWTRPPTRDEVKEHYVEITYS